MKNMAPAVAAIVLLLPLLYLGSYLALVKPRGTVKLWAGTVEHYRWGGKFAAITFWPLEQIDRKVRSQSWNSAPAIPY